MIVAARALLSRFTTSVGSLFRPSPAELANVSREERRVAKRYIVSQALCCHLDATLGADLKATVWNVSTTGIGLSVPKYIDPGTQLSLTVVNRDRKTTFSRPLNVIHCQIQVEGAYFVGGEYAQPASVQEIMDLVE